MGSGEFLPGGNPIVPGRTCEGCTLCCKLPPIRDKGLKKPADSWCKHCEPKKGCGIYEARPKTCMSFKCGYLIFEWLGEHWKPSKCKMVCLPPSQGVLFILMDPGYPDRWKTEPYFSEIMQMGAGLNGTSIEGLVVKSRGETIVILPDKAVTLGKIPQGSEFEVYSYRGEWCAMVTAPGRINTDEEKKHNLETQRVVA